MERQRSMARMARMVRIGGTSWGSAQWVCSVLGFGWAVYTWSQRSKGFGMVDDTQAGGMAGFAASGVS